MALCTAIDGVTQIEIPTFQDDPDEEEYSRVDNMEDMETLITKVMGYDSLYQFQFDTKVDPATLVGKFWVVMRNAVAIKGETSDEDFRDTMRERIQEDHEWTERQNRPN